MTPLKLLRAAVAPLLVALVAGCTGAASPTGTSSTVTFPLTLTSAGGKVTIPHRPNRIVSLSPTATEDLYAVGTVSTILQMLKLPDGTVKVLVEGVQRARIGRVLTEKANFEAEIELTEDVLRPIVSGHVVEERAGGIAGFGCRFVDEAQSEPVFGLQRPLGMPVMRPLVVA